MRCSSLFSLVLAGSAVLCLAWTSPARAGNIVSYLGAPNTLGFGGTTVNPGDLLDVDTGALVFDVFSTSPNIDAAHLLSDGTSLLLSVQTSMTLGGNFFLAGDVVTWDGTNSSARYTGTTLGTTGTDAVFLFNEGPSETLLFSSSASFTLDSQSFTSADLVLWDGSTASLFGDAPPITGGVVNARNIDAIHVLANGNVVFSTAQDGASITGLAGTIEDEDLILWDPVAMTASLYLDGTGLFDGPATADLDAVTFIPEPATAALLAAGLLGLGARRRRGRA